VVAQNRPGEAHHPVDALPRVRAVAHDVAQTGDLIDTLCLHIGKHCLECFQVAVDIAQNRPPHTPLAGQRDRGKLFAVSSRPHDGLASGEVTGLQRPEGSLETAQSIQVNQFWKPHVTKVFV
jgi:hypothetical protein